MQDYMRGDAVEVEERLAQWMRRVEPTLCNSVAVGGSRGWRWHYSAGCDTRAQEGETHICLHVGRSIMVQPVAVLCACAFVLLLTADDEKPLPVGASSVAGRYPSALLQ